MTHPPADVPSLPLSVTCTPDAAFGETITALARRVAGGEGAPGADRFAEAVSRGVSACFDVLAAHERQTLSVELSSADGYCDGELRWPATDGNGGHEALAKVEAALTPLADVVECGERTGQAHCRLRCRRG